MLPESCRSAFRSRMLQRTELPATKNSFSRRSGHASLPSFARRIPIFAPPSLPDEKKKTPFPQMRKEGPAGLRPEKIARRPTLQD